MKKIFLLILLVMYPAYLMAASKGNSKFYDPPWKKHEQSKAVRWTLADWLAQKEKNRMMDMWLAMNSTPNDFEFYLGYDSVTYKVKSDPTPDELPTFRVNRWHLGAFATIVGLTANTVSEKDEDISGYDGAFNLRIFGQSIQSTNITLQYGVSNRDFPYQSLQRETIQNTFAGVLISLYITKYFGVEGNYRKYIKNKSSQERNFEGSRTEGTAFIDFNFFRVYGTWFKEPITITDINSIDSTNTREGVGVGCRIFF